MGGSRCHVLGETKTTVYRVVDMFTHCTHASVKKKIVEQFSIESLLRVVIATIAFGMGMNCRDIRQIIHWGIPQDAESTCRRVDVQEEMESNQLQ